MGIKMASSSIDAMLCFLKYEGFEAEYCEDKPSCIAINGGLTGVALQYPGKPKMKCDIFFYEGEAQIVYIRMEQIGANEVNAILELEKVNLCDPNGIDELRNKLEMFK